MSNALGVKVKELRKKKGLTLEALANSIDAKKSYVWEIENGRIKCPSFEKINSIAQALGVTVEYFTDKVNLNKDNNLEQTVFFRKMGELTQDDQDKIMKIIDAWSNGE